MRDISSESSATEYRETYYWRAMKHLIAVGQKPFQNIQEAVDCLCQEFMLVTGGCARLVLSSQPETNKQTGSFSALTIPVYGNQKLYGKLIVFSPDEHSLTPVLSPEIASALAVLCSYLLSTFEIKLYIQEQYEQFDLTACQPLTDREKELLSMIKAGRTDQEMARSLSLTLNTLRTHRRNIYDKLNVHSKRDAIMVSRLLQLLSS